MTVYLTTLLDVNFFFYLLQSEAACVGTMRLYSGLVSFLCITYTPCAVTGLYTHSLNDLSSGPQPEKRTDKTKTLAGVLHGCVVLPMSEVGGNTRVHI